MYGQRHRQDFLFCKSFDNKLYTEQLCMLTVFKSCEELLCFIYGSCGLGSVFFLSIYLFFMFLRWSCEEFYVFSRDPMKNFMFFRRSYEEFYVLIFSSENEFAYLMFESIQVLFIQILFLLIHNIDNKVMICFIFWLYLIKLLSLWLINHTLIHCLRNGCC